MSSHPSEARSSAAESHDQRPQSQAGAEAPVARSDPYRGPFLLLLLVMGITLPIVIAVSVANLPPRQFSEWKPIARELGVEPYELGVGASVFSRSCATCHGGSGQGKPGLGKPLRGSAYVRSRTDQQLIELVTAGRPASDPENTTGVAMPPRAGMGLSDDDIRFSIVYVRSLQREGPSGERLASLDGGVDASSVPGGSDLTSEAVLAASTPEARRLYLASCASCHGVNGEGVDGSGKPLASSEFVASKSDTELMRFVKQGRPVWDAQNTTGIDMPPKGGNPALTDGELEQILVHIRAINAGS